MWLCSCGKERMRCGKSCGSGPSGCPSGAETGVTVSWEEICRYLNSLAVRGRQRETIQVYRPKLEAFFRFLPRGRLVTARTLEDWRLSLLKAATPPARSHPHLSGQRPAGLSGPAGPAADRPAGHRRGDPAGADQGGVSAPADHGPDPGTGAHLSAGEDIRPDGAAGRGTGPDDGRGGGGGPGLCR